MGHFTTSVIGKPQFYPWILGCFFQPTWQHRGNHHSLWQVGMISTTPVGDFFQVWFGCWNSVTSSSPNHITNTPCHKWSHKRIDPILSQVLLVDQLMQMDRRGYIRDLTCAERVVIFAPSRKWIGEESTDHTQSD